MTQLEKPSPSPTARHSRVRPFLAAAIVVALLGGFAALLWPRPDPDALFQEAVADFEASRFDQVQARLDRLARLRPPTPNDRMLRAQVALTRNRIDDAIGDLDQVPDDHRMASQARFEAGHLEIQRARFASAERYLLRALKLDPKMIKARRELVYIYGTQLRRDDLDANFRVLARDSSLAYSEVFLWCLSRGVQWEASEIVETLDRCVKADPDDRWARLGRAEGLRALGRFDEADEMLAPLPESDPEARAARVRLARARGDDTLAETLLAGGPVEHVGLATLRGQLALARGNPQEALRQFRIAHKLAPRLRETVFGLGQALQASGDAAAAAPYLEEARNYDRLGSLIQRAAVTSNRDDIQLVHDLGAACAAVGRTAEARAWYNIALTRDPLDPQALQALAKIKDP